MERVYNYRDTWASREGVDSCSLNEWAGTVKLKTTLNGSSFMGIKREIIVCKKYYTEVIRNELAGKSGKASDAFPLFPVSNHISIVFLKTTIMLLLAYL